MDKTITCRDCQKDFTLTEGEQQFFQQMGYQEPKRCKPCRNQRKQQATPNQQKETHGSPGNSNRKPVQWTNGSDGAERGGDKPRRDGNRRRDRRSDSDDRY